MEAKTFTRKLTVPEAYDLARRRHLEGALAQAREVYQGIVEVLPDHAQSISMLASIAYCEGDDQAGQTYLDQAIGLSQAHLQRMPDDLAMKAALTNFLLARNRIAEAEALVPDLTLALNPVRATDEEFAVRRQDGIERKIPPIMISTIPKSASESIWNKLAQGLGLAQCYLSIGLFPDCCLIPARVNQAAAGGVITKEHFGPTHHNLAILAKNDLNRIVVHLRDPRQATLSWVHFARDEINKRLMAPLWRKIVPPAGVLNADLATQIDWSLENYLPLLLQFIEDWRRIDEDSNQPASILFMTFEEFRTEPDAYFGRILDFYDIARDRFAENAQAEVIHLRKGETDEWRSIFTEAQRKRAWEIIPSDQAKAFGWEP